MQAYSSWQTPLYKDVDRKSKYFDVPLNARFDTVSPISVNGLWEIEYLSKDKLYTGWIEDKYLEFYNHNLHTNVVDLEGIQTPELNDAQQYIFWDGFKRVNMCGELCVAETLKLPLVDILTKWETVDAPFYKRVVPPNKRDVGTVHDDLIRLYGLFGHTAQRLNLKKYTPRLFSELVQNTKRVTVSTRLNTQTGALNGSGILHWCNVVEVIVEGIDMGWVVLYNPFGNRHELYSWREFLATTKSPYGVIA